MNSLTDHTLVITGGNGALGRAAAARAKALGARTVLLDRLFDEALLSEHECLVTDLTALDAVSKTLARIGPIHGLFNIAGGFDMGRPVADPDDSQWQAMFQMNVQTLRNVLKVAIPGMRARKRGSIVNVGALSAREGKAQMSAYTASKAVVMNLTESLAAEVAKDKLRVNAVLPSIIDTPANRAAMPGADTSTWVQPAALADVMCFLASDASRAITGALIPVTAGQG